MSRFADPRSTTLVPLGACECPGTPHPDGDWAKVRSDLSGADIATIAGLSTTDEDEAALGLAPYVTEWNLRNPDGGEWPPEADSLLALHQDTMRLIVEAIATAVKESRALPNPSGAPSPASSRGSASRTPKARRTPTT